jgi:acetyltransferase-like isoleucine patch superfamily enzyme
MTAHSHNRDRLISRVQKELIGPGSDIFECTDKVNFTDEVIEGKPLQRYFSAILFPKQVAINGGVNIGEKVFIGSLASLAPRIKIADNTKISASSAVFKDVKEKAMLLGVPAQKYPLI